MAKLSIVICAVLLASVACDQRAEGASQNYFGRAKPTCVQSVELAFHKISDLFNNTVTQIRNPHDKDIMGMIYAQANEIFTELIPTTRLMTTMGASSEEVQSAFGDAINCPKRIAIYVRDVTDQVVFELNHIVHISSY